MYVRNDFYGAIIFDDLGKTRKCKISNYFYDCDVGNYRFYDATLKEDVYVSYKNVINLDAGQYKHNSVANILSGLTITNKNILSYNKKKDVMTLCDDLTGLYQGTVKKNLNCSNSIFKQLGLIDVDTNVSKTSYESYNYNLNYDGLIDIFLSFAIYRIQCEYSNLVFPHIIKKKLTRIYPNIFSVMDILLNNTNNLSKNTIVVNTPIDKIKNNIANPNLLYEKPDLDYDTFCNAYKLDKMVLPKLNYVDYDEIIKKTELIKNHITIINSKLELIKKYLNTETKNKLSSFARNKLKKILEFKLQQNYLFFVKMGRPRNLSQIFEDILINICNIPIKDLDLICELELNIHDIDFVNKIIDGDKNLENLFFIYSELQNIKNIFISL